MRGELFVEAKQSISAVFAGLCAVFPQHPGIGTISFQRGAGGCLMVHRRQIPPAADDGQKTLEFPAHGVRPFEHAHLVKPADHQKIRIFPAYGGYVHAGLALQGQDALNAGSAEPRHRPCDVTIRIHEHTGAVFLISGIRRW